jgi:tRNA(adenine34) deaminase
MTTLSPPSPIGAWDSIDHFYMELAIAQARQAEQEGEVPVGAILVLERSIIGAGHNRPIQRRDPTAHAEIEVLRQAATRLGNYRLPGTTLYVTVEPCAMCAGALVNARVTRLVYGTSDPRAGAVETHFQVSNHPSLNHRVISSGGVLGDECRELLQRFFQERRAKRLLPDEGSADLGT